MNFSKSSNLNLTRIATLGVALLEELFPAEPAPERRNGSGPLAEPEELDEPPMPFPMSAFADVGYPVPEPPVAFVPQELPQEDTDLLIMLNHWKHDPHFRDQFRGANPEEIWRGIRTMRTADLSYLDAAFIAALFLLTEIPEGTCRDVLHRAGADLAKVRAGQLGLDGEQTPAPNPPAAKPA